MCRRLILVSFGILVLAVGAIHADLSSGPRIAIEDAITPHTSGGATGACSIQYYKLCRWLLLWDGFTPGDKVGVIFDLPVDCNKLPGEVCVNMGFWWYWRYTVPGYGYTLSYYLYNVDALGCLAGPPLGSIAGQDPVERWNCFAGLGGPITCERVAIIASSDVGGPPYMVTDNNEHDLADPTNCPGYSPHTVPHSFAWHYGPTSYCPPPCFSDDLGPVEIIMDASFSCEPIATQSESWTGVKRLFR